MPQQHDIKDVNYPLVAALHDVWKRKCRRHVIPSRDDLQPFEIKSLLPSILIAEPVFSPFRIRYRLVGTKLVRIAGFDFTGAYLDELLPSDEEDWHRHYLACYETAAPVFGWVSTRSMGGSPLTYGFGIFPLHAGNNVVSQFISVEDFGDDEPASGQLAKSRCRRSNA